VKLNKRLQLPLQAGKGEEARAEVGAAGSSVDLWASIPHEERSGSAVTRRNKDVKTGV